MSDSKKKLIEGLALALAFLVTSFILYLVPEFIGHQIVTRSIGVILGIIGLMGFMVELSKLNFSSNPELKGAVKDVSVGIFIGIIILLLLYFFTNWVVHLLVTLLMLVGIYGVLQGVLKVLLLTDFSSHNMLIKVPVIILNIAIFILTILQLLQIFKVIDK